MVERMAVRSADVKVVVWVGPRAALMAGQLVVSKAVEKADHLVASRGSQQAGAKAAYWAVSWARQKAVQKADRSGW